MKHSNCFFLKGEASSKISSLSKMNFGKKKVGEFSLPPPPKKKDDKLVVIVGLCVFSVGSEGTPFGSTGA